MIKIVVMPILKIKTARDSVFSDRMLNTFSCQKETIVHPDNDVKYAMRNANSQWMAAKLSVYICTLSGVHIPVELETGS